MLSARLVLIVAAAGCTSSTTMTFEFFADVPDLVAYREGTSPWKMPKPQSGGSYAAHHYSFDVSGEYELLAVSVDPTSGKATSTELRATPEDGARWYMDDGGAYEVDNLIIASSPSTIGFCEPPNMPLNISGSVLASGSMVQAGQISIGGWCTSSTRPSWSFQLSVAPGIHNVIATDPMGSPAPRVAITRGVDLEAATSLPAIDLNASGLALDSETITVINTGTELNDGVPISSKLELHADSEGATLASSTDRATSRDHVVPLVPASLLQSNDYQVLSISVTDYANAVRSASTRHPTETPGFEFLTPPTVDYSVDNGVDIASWSDPLSTRIQMVYMQTFAIDTSGNISSEAIAATARWLDNNHQMNLAFDPDVPGFEPSWAVDVTQSRQSDIGVTGIEGHISYTTTQSQRHTP